MGGLMHLFYDFVVNFRESNCEQRVTWTLYIAVVDSIRRTRKLGYHRVVRTMRLGSQHGIKFISLSNGYITYN